MRDEQYVLDAGVQLERTSLSWVRTALEGAVVAALLCRVTLDAAAATMGLVFAVVAAAALLVEVVVLRSHGARVRSIRARHRVTMPLGARAVATLVSLTAMVAVALLLAPLAMAATVVTQFG